MRKHGNAWTYSPSDLIQFLENEAVTWFNRFEIERPGVLLRDEEAASENLIQLAGDEHERRFLEQMLAEERDVADLRDVTDGGARTLEAMRSGREVIYQGHLEAAEFAGYADFLIRVDGSSDLGCYHYEVWDTKLARGLKPYFAIQLCCYAELLEAVQSRMPKYLGIVLGSGSQEQLQTDDYFFYYKAIKRAFLEQQHTFDADRPPRLSGTADYRQWRGHVTRLLEQRDDLSFVANIRASQIDKLQVAGITTMTELATLQEDVPTIQTGTLNRLRTKARLQLASRSNATLRFELVAHDPERPRLGFGGLPPRSRNDVCFDIEGYPLIEGGIEYLFGAVYYEDLLVTFRDWWAHNRKQERDSLEKFILWAHARWREDPGMHIYHWTKPLRGRNQVEVQFVNPEIYPSLTPRLVP